MTNEEAYWMAKALRKDTAGSMREFYNVVIAALEEEPCDDAISRRAAIDEIRFGQSYVTKISSTGALEHLFDKENKALEEAVERIEELPSVTPKQKTAQWKWLRNDVVMCDKCGYVQTLVDFDEDKRGKNYCPSCGRKMEDEE